MKSQSHSMKRLKVGCCLAALLVLNTTTYGQKPAKPANTLEDIQRAIVLQHFGSFLEAPPEPGEVEMFLFEMDRSNPGYFGDPSEGGGGWADPYEPFAETEKCKLAKADTNALLMQMGLAYAESLVSCGAIIIPWFGGLSVPVCLFVSAGTMALAYAVVNAAKKQRLECRGY